jgi:hypothetical protein
MRWIVEGQNSLCLYLTVTDEELEVIKNNNRFYTDEEFNLRCVNSVGDNAHIFTVYADVGIKCMIKHLNILRNKYKTVSWWDKKREKFICLS